jgi:hypothetical protein
MILVLGDFGYWEHREEGVLFLDGLNIIAEEMEMPIVWLDGNHENHVMLREKYFDQPRDPHGWIPIRPWIAHSPRGNIFTIGSKKIATFGGAWSIDRGHRTFGKSWWIEEVIYQDEVDAMPTEHFDVILTHDVPTQVDMRAVAAIQGGTFSIIPAAEKNRKMLDQVARKCTPDQIFHGHYHVAYTQMVDFDHGVVRVEGLNCDGSGAMSWTVLDI